MNTKNIESGHTQVYAVCGKGGVGKTAFTALMAKALINRKDCGNILLIDADPALGLTNALGIKVEKTIGKVRETVIDTARKGSESDKVELAEMLDYMLLETLVEKDDFSLLAMGRSESQGCFCSVNTLLRDAINVLSEKFQTILIDGEAGLEQINRQVISNLDCLMVLTDGSARGLQTVMLLKEMVEKDQVVSCDKLGVIFNRANGNHELLKKSAKDIGINVFGIVSQDEEVADYDTRGEALINLSTINPAYKAIDVILANIKQL